MNPAAVLISDVHYNVHTLKLADAAMRMAIDKANELKVPLIVAGDLHDTKANLRGECINAMIKTFQTAVLKPFVLVGNHDRINEKAPAHSLEFLRAYANIIDKPMKNIIPYLTLMPYYHDPEELRAYLKVFKPGSTLVMHQGFTNSKAGDYIQDKSAISPEDVIGLRVISGHYHTRQTIKLLGNGTWDYIGNPYSLGFSEANDPPKGFQILMDDGTLEFVPTNLRKHVIYEFDIEEIASCGIGKLDCNDNDLVWIKIHGSKEDLATVTRGLVSKDICREIFKLDLIPTDTKSQVSEHKNLTQGPLLDFLIDSLINTSDECKARLKDKWKQLCE